MTTIAGLKVETVLNAYIEAALWSSTDDNDLPLDNYEPSDGLRETFHATIVEFLTENSAVIETAECAKSDKASQFGHDLWLTQAGHGVGFWEDDTWTKGGDELTHLADAMGEQWLYVNDDGMVDLG